MTQELDERNLQLAFTQRRTPLRDHCPTAEILWETLSGTTSMDVQDQVLDHLASCADCAEDWRLGLEILRNRRAARPSTRPIVYPLAAAAALMVVALGGWLVFTQNQDVEYRGGDEPEQTATQTLPADQFVLTWSAGTNYLYRVRVFDQSLARLLYEGETEDTSLQVPPLSFAASDVNTLVYWQLDLIDKRTGVIQQRGPFAVRLIAAPRTQ